MVFKATSGPSFPLACGQCIGCRAERSRQWAVRCMHEAQMHERNSFITLTYDREHLPRNVSVDVREWQLFAKGLRNVGLRFRYFACGEYGEESNRPHYHACLFGEDFGSDRRPVDVNERGETLFTSKLLEEVWGKGMVRVGALSYESAAYVARYVMKKATDGLKGAEYRAKRYTRFDSDTGETWEVAPEFVVMSRGARKGEKGIGGSWFDKFMSDVYPADEVILGGRRFRPPRYYDSKLEEEYLAKLKAKRVETAVKHEEENAPARLLVREEFARRVLARRSKV